MFKRMSLYLELHIGVLQYLSYTCNCYLCFQAESVENTGACGNDLIMSHMVGVRDAVTRKLLVEVNKLLYPYLK